jgi:hypothetical protein
MIYSKSEVARIQLERAIDMFFEIEDYVSAVTLSGASEEITKCMLEREGKTPAINEVKTWVDENHPVSDLNGSFFKHANFTRNGLKHFSDPAEDTIEVNKAEAVSWLCRAILNYDRAHSSLTEPMSKYIAWWKSENA